MADNMLRSARAGSVTIANGAALSGAFALAHHTMGVLYKPATWTAADIGFYVCQQEAGTYMPLYNVNGVLVNITGLSTTVVEAYALPAELAGCRYVKVWSQNSGTSANQGAARVIALDLKA